MNNKSSLRKKIFIYYITSFSICYLSFITISIISIINIQNRYLTITIILLFILITIFFIWFLVHISRLIEPINDLDKHISQLKELQYYSSKEYYDCSTYLNMSRHIQELSNYLEELNEKYNKASLIVNEYNKNKEEIEIQEKDLIYSISHELKTPLSVIEASAYAILDKIYEGEEADLQLNKIIEQCKLSISMIQDVLNVFKLNRSDFDLKYEEINLKELILNKVNSFKEVILEYEHELVINLDECIINTDSKQLTTVLSNIINNAITNSPNGSKIVVNLINKENEFIIEVINSNSSIPQEKLDHIFNPFVKIDESHKRKNYTGNGLGLYIVKQILTKFKYDFGILNTVNGVKFFIIGKK